MTIGQFVPQTPGEWSWSYWRMVAIDMVLFTAAGNQNLTGSMVLHVCDLVLIGAAVWAADRRNEPAKPKAERVREWT